MKNIVEYYINHNKNLCSPLQEEQLQSSPSINPTDLNPLITYLALNNYLSEFETELEKRRAMLNLLLIDPIPKEDSTNLVDSGTVFKIMREGKLERDQLTELFNSLQRRKADKSELFSKKYSDLTGVPKKLSNFENDLNLISQTYLLELLLNYKSEIQEYIQHNQGEIDPQQVSEVVTQLVIEKLSRLAQVAFSGDYDDLTSKPDIPTKVSDLENDSLYVTSSEVSSEVSSAVNTAVSSLVNGAPEALDTLKEIADKLGDNDDAVAGLINQIIKETSRAKSAEETLSTTLNNEISRAQAAEKVNSDNINALNTALNQEISRAQEAEAEKANDSELATVAKSGDYKDLKNVPVIEDNPGNREYVDLGLPSGTLWATMNVGANSETDCGNYYQYGKGAAQYIATNGDSNYSGTEDPLDSSVDTATQVLGGSWHMPTRAQIQELIANTTYQWVTNYQDSGINGGLFTAQNGAVLFLPAAGYWNNGSQTSVSNVGYYWGSSADGSYTSYNLNFDNGYRGVNNYNRKYGCSVRGVLDPTPINKLHKVAESGDYNDLENTPTDVSHFNNDANYVTKEELDNTEEVVAAALNDLNTNKADKIEVFPVKATYEEMVEMRDQGKFILGLYYQITDYVTTVNELLNPNAQSAGHQFDILVRADSTNTLNELAWAIRHDGDTYFKDARLEAWQLKYRLDNVQWSKQAGTYVTDEDNVYTFLVIGDITLSGHTYKLLQGFGMYVDDWSDYALMETVAEGEQIICYYGDPEDFDPEEPEVVGTARGVEEVTEAGKGTIVYMKDEWGNEAGYDFKNIQQKRWKVTDELNRSSLNGKYLGVLNNLPAKLSIEDEEDFIWAYLYSVYDYAGGTQDTTDHSLTGKVHEMVTNFTVDSNNAFVWEGGYREAYKCTFSGSVGNCSFSGDVNNNSFSGNVQYNSFSGDVYQNSFSGGVASCSFSGNVYQNSFSENVQYNSFSGDVNNNSFSGYMQNNTFSGYVASCSFSGDVYQNSFSGDVNNNSFSGSVGNCSFSGNVQYNSFSGYVASCSFSGNLQNSIISGQLNNLQIKVSSGASGIINCLYTLGKIDGKTITVPTNAAYPTYAAMTTAGQLKTWNPSD